MADTSDVETALVTSVLGALYPAGLDQASTLGRPIRVYRGWPLAGPLEADLLGGVANVSVLAASGTARNTTRWMPTVAVTLGVTTLYAEVSGASVTLTGTAGLGQVVGLLVDDAAFIHRCASGDTPATVAAVLALAVRAARTCWLAGATLTVPGADRFVARVGADGSTTTEWGRQEQEFRLTTWSPDPGTRDSLCRLLGGAFSAVTFLTLPDGSAGRLRYVTTSSSDDRQDAGEYRRDLVYAVDFGVSETVTSPVMLFGDLNWSGDMILA